MLDGAIVAVFAQIEAAAVLARGRRSAGARRTRLRWEYRAEKKITRAGCLFACHRPELGPFSSKSRSRAARSNCWHVELQSCRDEASAEAVADPRHYFGSS